MTENEFSLFPLSTRNIRNINVSAAGNDTCLACVLLAGAHDKGWPEYFE
jgi:hypothetical protein